MNYSEDFGITEQEFNALPHEAKAKLTKQFQATETIEESAKDDSDSDESFDSELPLGWEFSADKKSITSMKGISYKITDTPKSRTLSTLEAQCLSVTPLVKRNGMSTNTRLVFKLSNGEVVFTIANKAQMDTLYAGIAEGTKGLINLEKSIEGVSTFTLGKYHLIDTVSQTRVNGFTTTKEVITMEHKMQILNLMSQGIDLETINKILAL